MANFQFLDSDTSMFGLVGNTGRFFMCHQCENGISSNSRNCLVNDLRNE